MSGEGSRAAIQTQPTPTPEPSPIEVDFSGNGLPDYGILPEWVPSWTADLGAAVLVIGLTWLAARLVTIVLGRRIAQLFQRPSLTKAALRAIRLGVYLIGFLTILRIFGLSLGNIALQVTVLTAVVGVILAPILSSYISGMFLLADQPYEIGDMVEIVDESERGYVSDITLRYTKITTLDNTFVVVPNGEIRKRDVINFSAEDSRTRQTLDIVVTYEGDLDAARETIERAAREVDGVIEGGPNIRIGAARYPAAPTCYIERFGDHGVHLRLRYWLDEPYKLLTARSRIQTNVWNRLEDKDVEIAYPHQHHVFDETSGQIGVAVGDGSRNDTTPAALGSRRGNRPEDERSPNGRDGGAVDGVETGDGEQ